ncbi:hypothetical protein CROQUDRAFT_85571, partial [Cronartium quercuum f. sp. fusiforme G11]
FGIDRSKLPKTPQKPSRNLLRSSPKSPAEIWESNASAEPTGASKKIRLTAHSANLTHPDLDVTADNPILEPSQQVPDILRKQRVSDLVREEKVENLPVVLNKPKDFLLQLFKGSKSKLTAEQLIAGDIKTRPPPASSPENTNAMSAELQAEMASMTDNIDQLHILQHTVASRPAPPRPAPNDKPKTYAGTTRSKSRGQQLNNHPSKPAIQAQAITKKPTTTVLPQHFPVLVLS